MPRRVAVLESQLAEVTEQLEQQVSQSEFLQENLAQLELAIDEQGWQRLSLDTEWEFSRDGLDRIIALSRLNTLKNPLIRRGVLVKADYVTGQGVEIAARDAGINELVIQPFLDDPANANVLFDDVALPEAQRTLTTDGNLAFVLFPNVFTGHVSVRSIDIGEIRDVVTNPDDASEVWFYLRRWTERLFSLDGPAAGFRTARREAWYPDWRHEPAQKPESIDRIPVRWGSPIYHAKVGGLRGMRFGVPETYAALDWAKAYKLFLEDWATIVRSLSRFAWKLKVDKNPTAAAARLNSTATTSSRETNPSPTAGSVFTGNATSDLQAIPKTDAVIKSEDGIQLAKMVGAALGIPYTILMGDPDMGNLATAKTLDRPTELGMMAAQRVMARVLGDLCSYAIDWAIRSPGGKLTGRQEKGPDGKPRWVVDDVEVTDPGADEKRIVTGADRRTVDVVFPPILEDNVLDMVKAIVLAEGTELPPPEVILRLLLTVFGVEDVDEHIARLPERLEQRDKERGERFDQGEDPFASAGGDDGT